MRNYSFKIGKWFVSVAENLLFDELGEEVHIEPKAMDLLQALVAANGEVVGREEIMQTVWNGRFVTDYALNSSIASLRKHLDPANKNTYIVTRPKRGYQICANIIKPELSSHSNSSDIYKKDDDENQPYTSRERRPLFSFWLENKWAYFAVFALIIAAAVYIGNTRLSAQQTSPPLYKSLAVMPFSYDKNNTEIAYIAFGLPGEIIDMISAKQAFEIRDRRSSFDLAKTENNAKSIADQLQVSYVLQGLVEQTGNEQEYFLRWSLVDELGLEIETGEYTIDEGNIIETQNKIAQRVMQIISGEEQLDDTLRYGKTKNTLAYIELLKGRQQNAIGTLDAHIKALEHFKMAVALDPEYAMALVDLSIGYMLLHSNKHISLEDANASAKPLLEKALKLEPNMPSAIAAKGIFAMYNNQRTLARDYYIKALDLDPNLYIARFNLAFLYRNAGYWKEALKHYEIAKKLYPIAPNVVFNIARMHFQLGHVAKAIEQLEYCVGFAIYNSSCHLELAYLQRLQGQHEKANATFQIVLDKKPENIGYGLKLNIAFHAHWQGDFDTFESFHEDIHAELGVDLYEPDSYAKLKWRNGEQEAYFESIKTNLDLRIKQKQVNQKQVRGLALLAYSIKDCQTSIDYYEYAFSNKPERSYTGFSEWAEGHSPTLYIASCYQQLGEADKAEALISLVSSKLAEVGPVAKEMPGVIFIQHRLNMLNNPSYEDPKLKQRLEELGYPFVWLLEKDWFFHQKRLY